MRLGVVFPQTEIGSDPAAIRDYAQAAKSLGCDHLLAYDHVLGANATSHDLNGPYTHTDPFHESFVLYGYLAAVTQKIELVTGILILPQRQTALVAKQAAAVDILSGGRLRLGIGTGWNHVEYEALGMNFHDRGRRSEEQVELMRLLWTKDLVTFEGKWHKITDAGLNPLPIQRPIPIWFGGQADAVLRRVAALGDGWFPLFAPDDQGRAQIEQLHQYAREAGREPGSIGIESWVNIRGKSPESWADEVSRWRELGATHISVNTMNAGMSSLDDHIHALEGFKEAVAGI
jgi:probable F420-dependent oxidoreductase